MKKCLTVILLLMVLLLSGCTAESIVLDSPKSYELSDDIHSLELQINAADIKIVTADDFALMSNLKTLPLRKRMAYCISSIPPKATSASTILGRC